jgi:hypothetical protein
VKWSATLADFEPHLSGAQCYQALSLNQVSLSLRRAIFRGGASTADRSGWGLGIEPTNLTVTPDDSIGLSSAIH